MSLFPPPRARRRAGLLHPRPLESGATTKNGWTSNGKPYLRAAPGYLCVPRIPSTALISKVALLAVRPS